MAMQAYPFDAQDVSEVQFGALQGSAFITGVAGAPSSDHFKVTANGSNMTLTVTTVGGNSQVNIRGHAGIFTSNEVVTVTAADSQARVDLVVLRLNYANNTIAPLILKGTAGVATPPTPVWGAGNFYDLPIARVAVGGNVLFITPANVTDVRRFAGFTPGAWPSVNRPATHVSLGWNTTDARWEYTLDGVNWTALTATDLASNGVTGVLPLTKGGTGTNSAVSALQALGIFVQATQPAYAAGRVWIKIP